MRLLFSFICLSVPLALSGMAMANDLPDAALAADVVVLGEVHDNPVHHSNQAEWVTALTPTAIVAEMLTPDQAADLQADPEGYRATWDASGWPEYDMYLPVFTATDAPIYGAAVPRDVARVVYSEGVAAHFDGDAGAYGLVDPLPGDQNAVRLDLQFAAHCDAMPRAALGGMIEVQRLRDATLAKAAIQASDDTGEDSAGPVVVITGNGHARKDWGVPSYIARVRPDLTVFSIGQGEDGGTPDGGFDLVVDAPAVGRPDPCLEFGKPSE
ncbi:ChaN family lipoprotein [Aliiroseovarius lamellibrachiae]|uniref:ChaN family lipoprotein n=1 Tax=Aliiroseovarius lamellibrachiae TaxID=1924933 RepID=UPI001FE8CE66|nr:ChaN family lipoprotein [Aliiroseovarius lamellibrachiae]